MLRLELEISPIKNFYATETELGKAVVTEDLFPT